jgi:hypothetical protein
MDVEDAFLEPLGLCGADAAPGCFKYGSLGGTTRQKGGVLRRDGPVRATLPQDHTDPRAAPSGLGLLSG